MQIRIGQYDEVARRRDGEGIVFVVGQRKLVESRGRGVPGGEAGGARKRKRRRGMRAREGEDRGLVKRERGWIRLGSATAADPGNSDGVGPKALSVADKPPRSDNTLYIAAPTKSDPRRTRR